MSCWLLSRGLFISGSGSLPAAFGFTGSLLSQLFQVCSVLGWNVGCFSRYFWATFPVLESLSRVNYIFKYFWEIQTLQWTKKNKKTENKEKNIFKGKYNNTQKHIIKRYVAYVWIGRTCVIWYRSNIKNTMKSKTMRTRVEKHRKLNKTVKGLKMGLK